MPHARPAPARRLPTILAACLALAAAPGSAPAEGPRPSPFRSFELPEEWQQRFWADEGTKSALALEPKALADLVPAQAGLRFCRCPACGAAEADEPLRWSAVRPESLRCARCGVTVPNDEYPAKTPEKKVPEEAIEVRPGVMHRYPYHAVPVERQAVADERLYLDARRDYEAREYLAKFAMYAAIRHRDRPDPGLATRAAALLIRFAQVYPNYAVHYDQPGESKFLQPADTPPPYRRGYRSARWDWTASQEVPLNLAISFAILRDDPAMVRAGALLGEPDPAGRVERDLFRRAAKFLVDQPEEADEAALVAHRGVLAVGRLLDDPGLVREAVARLDRLGRSGFYHDGIWRGPGSGRQRRVVELIDGWIARLLDREFDAPMLALAREAGAAGWPGGPVGTVRRAAWPIPGPNGPAPRPVLLGGAGIARLSVGSGADALDLELRAPGSLAAPQSGRLAVRVAVGGRTVLGDTDDAPPDPTGFGLSTAGQNCVMVDGLNQRESTALAAIPSRGGDPRFFAADPDFQIAAFDDPRAYPRSATRYRQMAVASAGRASRYAVAVFEAEGGLQHDQLWHAPGGSGAAFRPSVAVGPAAERLLAPGIPYLPQARAEDGRWFVQALGAVADLRQAPMDRPARADLPGRDGPGVRLHLLGDLPATLHVGATPDPARPSGSPPDRGALVVRRRSEDGATLRTAFVTLFEPLGPGPRFPRVGRAESSPEVVVLYVETADGPEHLVLNLLPGLKVEARLADGRALATDGLAARVRGDELTLAGGTFAEVEGHRVEQRRRSGRIVDARRRASPGALGWFDSDLPLADPGALAGRVLLIHHGDGTVRGWTLRGAENLPEGGARLHVREEPGFALTNGGAARDYQYPGGEYAGPHEFTVCTLVRSKRALRAQNPNPNP